MADVLKQGQKGEAVKQLQEGLQALGFAVEPDGIFGEKTHNAVVALQTIFGYDVDGLVGPATQKLVAQQRGLGWQLQAARDGGYPRRAQS